MAKIVLKNEQVLLGKVDLTRMVKTFGWSAKGESFDATTLGSNTKEKLAGLPDSELSLEGFWESGMGSLDEALFTGIGTVEEPVAMVIGTPTVADYTSFFFKAKHGTLKLFGEGNQPCPFSATAVCNGRPLKGWLMKDGAVTVAGTGTAVSTGGTGSSQTAFAAVCVTAGTFTNLVVRLESDDNGGFTTPTTRMTFATTSVLTSELVSLAGPITDTFWRAAWTIGSGSATIAVVFAKATTVLGS